MKDRPSAGSSPVLGQALFEKFAGLILRHSGIELNQSKHALLETRIRRRMGEVGVACFEEYLSLLERGARRGREIQGLVEAITTHETSFFRERHHFEALRAFAAQPETRHLRVWCAACSNGAEPYSAAMELEDSVEAGHLVSFQVLATDISTKVLEEARSGVYPDSVVASIPERRRSAYLLRSKRRPVVRVADRIRSRVSFEQINLTSAFRLDVVDVAFCRNVLIYFGERERSNVVRRILEHIRPGGLLMLGHAEGSVARGFECEPAGPTMVRKVSGPTASRRVGG